MSESIGEELVGWRREKAWELSLSDNEYSSHVEGYYHDRSVAVASGQGRGWYGGNGTVKEVDVITNGIYFYPVEPDASLFKDSDAILRAKLKEELLIKLQKQFKPEELEILGIVNEKA